MNSRLYERLYGLRIPLLIGFLVAVVLCILVILGGGSWLGTLLGRPAPVAVAPTATSPAVLPQPTKAATNTALPAPTPQPPPPPTATKVSQPTSLPTPTAAPTVAPTSAPPPPTPAPPAAAGAAPIVRRTVDGVYTVQAGDRLWTIATDLCGAGKSWSEIYAANRDKISNPDLIYPGQKLLIPCERR